MLEFVLIIFIHAGVFSGTDSMTMSTVGGFSSQQQCQQAGNIAKSLGNGTRKDVKFVCVQRTKQVK